MINEVKT